ncbi:hypothetical protein GVN16_04440 [Emticicia sp. CRIBPO]|uniref:hypothetical protein n=1 Tax=Emticicia sp. CRIBPO TaxID=2683258 RepID=UPI0014133862|nr:hypothetical protein [Emticicia sp. CRIBPO]NBA84993.1 hypothetical protein [Emticicia sp. CRIBPO]
MVLKKKTTTGNRFIEQDAIDNDFKGKTTAGNRFIGQDAIDNDFRGKTTTGNRFIEQDAIDNDFRGKNLSIKSGHQSNVKYRYHVVPKRSGRMQVFPRLSRLPCSVLRVPYSVFASKRKKESRLL